MSDEMGLVPVAWRYISSAKGAKWTVQKNRPTNVEAWPEYTVEPLYDAAAIEQLVAEVATLKIESSRHAYEADKAREDRDNAERRSEAFWSKQAKAAEAQRDKLKEALSALADAVGNMRVPQNTGEAAVQVALTIGPALTSARQALGDT